MAFTVRTIRKSQTYTTRGPGDRTLVVAEASEIGLAPGEWPDLIAFIDDDDGGHLLHKGLPDVHAGELRGFHYADGQRDLLVIND